MSDISIYDLVGKRVRLIMMEEDPNPVPPGTEGTVVGVGGDVIEMRWDNGRMLGMIWGLDQFEVIE
jgi:hypothetical protein